MEVFDEHDTKNRQVGFCYDPACATSYRERGLSSWRKGNYKVAHSGTWNAGAECPHSLKRRNA